MFRSFKRSIFGDKSTVKTGSKSAEMYDGQPAPGQIKMTVSGDPNATRKHPDERISAADFRRGPAVSHVAADLLHPNQDGLELVSAKELMEANRALIEQALDAFTYKQFMTDFDDQVLELIRRVAHWMGPMPASRQHHHAGRGGLFTHSLGVAVTALHMAGSRNVTYESSPRDKDAAQLAWELTCFTCGLLHDVGKLNTIGTAHVHSVVPETSGAGGFVSPAAPIYDHEWHPMVEGFERWAHSNKVRTYFIDWPEHEQGEHREYCERYVMALVPRSILSFIYAANKLTRQHFEDFIRNPESGARTPIFQVVQDADHFNVAQSIDPRRKPGSIEMNTLVIRRFTEFQNEAAWNLPTSPFIYAHVQLDTPEGTRFFGLPFFVATEENVATLTDYVVTRPTLGVSFGTRATELIFNALEGSEYMARTLGRLLPRQRLPFGRDQFLPASQARVRFAARVQPNTTGTAAEKVEDVILNLPLVPIRARPPLSTAMNGPIVAFVGEPTAKSAAVLNLSLRNGGVSTEDPAMEHDDTCTSVIAALNQVALEVGEATDVYADVPAFSPRTRPSAEATVEKTETKPASPPGGKKSARAHLDREPVKDLFDRLEETPEAEDRGDDAAALVPPVDQWPWFAQLYDRLLRNGDLVTDDGEEVPDPSVFYGVLWLYLSVTPVLGLKARAMGPGRYTIVGRHIGEKLRQDLMSAFSPYGLPATFLGKCWPRNETFSVAGHLTQARFATSTAPDGMNVFRLKASAASLLEQMWDFEDLHDLAEAAPQRS